VCLYACCVCFYVCVSVRACVQVSLCVCLFMHACVCMFKKFTFMALMYLTYFFMLAGCTNTCY